MTGHRKLLTMWNIFQYLEKVCFLLIKGQRATGKYNPIPGRSYILHSQHQGFLTPAGKVSEVFRHDCMLCNGIHVRRMRQS